MLLSPRATSSPVMPLLAITAVGAALRLFDLGQMSFWIDELITLCHADAISDVGTFFTPACGNAHPPLYFLLVKVWASWGGTEFYLRLLSALAGIATIPAAYALTREISGRTAALLVSGLVATSPFLLLHDRELRMYSLLTLLSVASLWSFLRALREGHRGDWMLFTLFTVLNLYVHYHALLLLAAESVLLLLWRNRVRNWTSALMSFGMIGIAFAFVVPTLLFQLQNPELFTLDAPDKFPVRAGGWVVRLGYLFYSFVLGQTLLPWRPWAVVGLVDLAVLAVLGVWAVRRRQHALVLFASIISLPIATGFVVSQTMPRYYLFLTPLLFVLVAEGWLAVRSLRWRVAAATMALVPIVLSVANYHRGHDFHILAPIDPWREVGQYLLEGARPGDCIVTIGSFRPVAYYTNEFEGFHRPVYNGEWNRAAECLDQDLERSLWIVWADASVRDVAQEAARWFDTRYSHVAERRFARDPEHLRKAQLFRRDFLEYRITVNVYRALPLDETDLSVPHG